MSLVRYFVRESFARLVQTEDESECDEFISLFILPLSTEVRGLTLQLLFVYLPELLDAVTSNLSENSISLLVQLLEPIVMMISVNDDAVVKRLQSNVWDVLIKAISKDLESEDVSDSEDESKLWLVEVIYTLNQMMLKIASDVYEFIILR